MRNRKFREASPEKDAEVIELFPDAEKPQTFSTTKPKGFFARHAGKSRWLTALAMVAFVSLVGLKAINQSDTVGLVGVVGPIAKGMELTKDRWLYEPRNPGVFLPNVPVGTMVQVTDLTTGKKTMAPVISNRAVFREDTGRVADVSPAVLNALGYAEEDEFADPTPRTNKARKEAEVQKGYKVPAPRQFSLRVLDGAFGGLKAMVPVLPNLQPAPRAFTRPVPSREEFQLYTLNAVNEGGEYGAFGGIAPAITVENRVSSGYRGTTTFEVIYAPKQYSWTWVPIKGPDKPGSPKWKLMEKVMLAYMNDRMSGDLLGLQYLMQDCISYMDLSATHERPWARSGEFRLIKMFNTIEQITGARCLAPPPTSVYGQRLAKMR